MIITGKATEGVGGAGSSNTYKKINQSCELNLVKGTLNIIPIYPDLSKIRQYLNCTTPYKILENHHTAKGDLKIWISDMVCPKIQDNPIYIVRLNESTTLYVEIMGTVNFRAKYNINNNAIIKIKLRIQNS